MCRLGLTRRRLSSARPLRAALLASPGRAPHRAAFPLYRLPLSHTTYPPTHTYTPALLVQLLWVALQLPLCPGCYSTVQAITVGEFGSGALAVDFYWRKFGFNSRGKFECTAAFVV